MRIAVYPGSFDPVSNGHLEILYRAVKEFDKVYVVVSFNPKKKYTFTSAERVSLLQRAIGNNPKIIVEENSDLLLNYAKEKNASIIIRGIRNINDFQNEITFFQFNQSINKEIDTFLLFPSTDNLFLSSSSIKELVIFNKSIENYVPKHLANEISRIIKERMI
jgi:pantetheine-phosphate adenylyltransferase